MWFGDYEKEIVYVPTVKSSIFSMGTIGSIDVGPLPSSHVQVGQGWWEFGANRGPAPQEMIVPVEHEEIMREQIFIANKHIIMNSWKAKENFPDLFRKKRQPVCLKRVE